MTADTQRYDYPLYVTRAELENSQRCKCHTREDCHNLQRATSGIVEIQPGEIDEDNIRKAGCCTRLNYQELEL